MGVGRLQAHRRGLAVRARIHDGGDRVEVDGEGADGRAVGSVLVLLLEARRDEALAEGRVVDDEVAADLRDPLRLEIARPRQQILVKDQRIAGGDDVEIAAD